MTCQSIRKGETEEIILLAVDKKRMPLAGLTDLKVRAVRLSNNDILDWTSWSFVPAPATPDVPLTAVAGLTGHYERVGGFQSGLIANLADSDDIVFEFSQSPGTNAYFQWSMKLLVRPDPGQHNGAIWIDPTNGDDGNEGTSNFPVQSDSRVATLLAQKGFERVEVDAALSVQLTQAWTGRSFWHGIGGTRNAARPTIRLNGQNLGGSTIFDRLGIFQTFTGTLRMSNGIVYNGVGGGSYVLDNCVLTGTHTPTTAILDGCRSSSSFTLNCGSLTGDVDIIDFESAEPVNLTNLADAARTVTVQLRRGELSIAASCTDGIIIVRGDCKITNSAPPSLTVIDERQDQRLSDAHGSGSWESDTAGSSQVTITIEDLATDPLPGVYISIYNSTNDVFLTRKISDTNGQAVFALDDGTYKVRLFKSGYSFTVPETLVVSGDGSQTYSATAQVTIVPPADPNLCAIYGFVDNAAGTSIAGACVECFAETPQSVAGFQKSERVASTLTDAEGAFQIDVVRTARIRFTITDPDGNIVIDEYKTVPDLASQDLEGWT